MEPTRSNLSLSGIIAHLPHDPASIFTMTLLVVAIAGLFWVSRPRS